MANQNVFIEKLHKIVYEHYIDEQFGVSDLVEGFGISRSQLHRKLKRATGQSISQFIREIRLQEALKLLQEEDMTASEVSYKVGFNSPTYFNTCFNEYFGYPPGETQHQLELTKLNDSTERDVIDTDLNKSGHSHNRRVILGLLIMTLIFALLISYKYYAPDKKLNTLTLTEKEKTIAVLPLKNWSGNLELEYISDGMTDAIISKLSDIGDIDRVIPFTSMMRYKDTQKDLQEIAKELNVAYILEGNFKLSGNKVQSNLKLIEASTLEHVWNLEYMGDWKMDEIFEMQAKVAENVATTMSAHVGSDELNVLQYQATTSEEAYRTFLKAEYQFNKLSQYGIKNSIGLYKRAIVLDSTYVEAYEGLAAAYIISGAVWGIIMQDEAWSKARPMLDKALMLDSLRNGRNGLLIKSQIFAGIFYYELDIRTAEQYFSKVIGEEVDFTNFNSAFDYTRKTGRWLITKYITEKDFARNLATGDAHMQLAITYYMLGEKDKAMKLLKISDPLQQDNYFYLQETSKWYLYMEEIEKSKQQLERMLTQFEDRPPINYWLTAIHGKIALEDDKLESSLNALRKQFADRASGSPAWFLALYYFYIGDNDTGFEWLQKSYDRREVEMTWLKEEPILQSVIKDPRYIELYNKMGFQYVNQELLK